MRYENPHQNFPMAPQMQQQRMQQPMYPQQMPMQQQPMMQPQQPPQVYQMPNGMIMTPYGAMSPQAFNSMMAGQQQPFGMQGQIPMNPMGTQQFVPQQQQPMMTQPQQVSSNQRFSGGNGGVGVSQQFVPTQSPVSAPDRFQTTNTTTQPAALTPVTTEESKVTGNQITPPDFQVAPKTKSVSDNSGVKFTTLTNEVSQSSVSEVNFQVGIPAVNNIDTGFDDLIEEAYKAESPKLVTTSQYFIYTTHYRVDMVAELTKMMTGELKNFFKSFKRAMEEVTNQRKLFLYSEINDYLTDNVNTYLSTNFSEYARIDSFVHDYHDLIKFVRLNFEDSEDDLNYYLESKLANMVEATEAQNGEESVKSKTVLSHRERLVYIDKFATETGLDQIELVTEGQDFVKVRDGYSGNQFVRSLVYSVYMETGSKEFILATVGLEAKFKVVLVPIEGTSNVTIYIKRLK